MAQRPELDIMMAAARQAGAVMLDDFAALTDPSKGIADAVTYTAAADKRAAISLGTALRNAYPSYGLFIEGEEEEPATGTNLRWIVDPMDGTANYVRGMSHWAVTIALEEGDQIIAAVVFDPIKDEMFIASKGGGAWLNGVQLRTSGKTALSEAMMATGMPMAGSAQVAPAMETFGAVLNACAGIRQWGAAALDLAYVAAGRLDGYWNRRLKQWHYAAGMLLVQEAGGVIAPVEGPDEALGDAGLVGICRDMYPTFAETV